DDHAAAGLRDQEIGTCDPDIRRQEELAQLGTRLSQDITAFAEYAVGWQIGVRLAEAFLPILSVEMERRRDDVARNFLTKLNNVFTKIRLDRLNTVPFEMIVDAQLLADHRLALGSRWGICRTADRQDGPASV